MDWQNVKRSWPTVSDDGRLGERIRGEFLVTSVGFHLARSADRSPYPSVVKQGDNLDLCRPAKPHEHMIVLFDLSAPAVLMITSCRLHRNSGHFLLSLVLAALTAIPGAGHTKDTVTPAIGFFRFDCLPGSDTHVSVPFQRPARWSGKLGASPADQGGGMMRLTLEGSPTFSAGELTTVPHLVICRDPSGPNGHHFPIAAHSAGTIDITAAPADLSGLVPGGLISVVPAWTLATLFPPASQTTFHPSSGPLAPQRGSELLFFNNGSEGIDLAPSRRFFVTTSGWFEAGAYDAADQVVILPGQAFVVRHRDTATATTFVPLDEVSNGAVSLPLPVANGSPRDTMVAPPRPTPVTLDQLDFAGMAFEQSTSTAAGDRKDQLLVFDSSAPSINREPSAIYFRSGSQWLRDTTGFPVSGSVAVEPSSGLLVRKASGATASVPRWSNAPTYDLTTP